MIELFDDEIILAIHRNDEEALQLLFFRYENSMRTIAIQFRFMFEKVGVEYEDLVQIIKEETLSLIYVYDNSKSAFFPFWRESLKKRLIGIFRTYQNKYEFLNDSYEFNEDLIGYHAKLEDPFSKDNSYLIRECLDIISSLSGEKQEVMRLWMEGYKYHEIAKITSLSEKKVGNIVYLSLVRIRKKLKI